MPALSSNGIAKIMNIMKCFQTSFKTLVKSKDFQLLRMNLHCSQPEWVSSKGMAGGVYVFWVQWSKTGLNSFSLPRILFSLLHIKQDLFVLACIRGANLLIFTPRFLPSSLSPIAPPRSEGRVESAWRLFDLTGRMCLRGEQNSIETSFSA